MTTTKQEISMIKKPAEKCSFTISNQDGPAVSFKAHGVILGIRHAVSLLTQDRRDLLIKLLIQDNKDQQASQIDPFTQTR